jgi:hypothetical protein
MNTNIIDIAGRKPNANNVLANLPPADQAQIKAWLQNHSFTATVAKINAPRPEGLGLNVHYTSVRNYYLDHVQLEQLIEQEADRDHVQDITALSAKIPYMDAVAIRLEKRLFELTLNPETPIKEIERVLRMVMRIHTLKLKRDQLALERQRIEAKASSCRPSPPTRRPERESHPAEATTTPEDLRSLFAEIQSLTSEVATPSKPPVNKENQELSSFPKPQPTKPGPVVLNNPNLPLPSIKPIIKK